MMAFCIWVTGLPGCGKSTISRELREGLEKDGIWAEILRLDELRRILTPRPQYTQKERDIVYRTLAAMAKVLTENNINAIIDATANKREYRNLARELIKNFAEVYVKCPIETCIERESKRDDGVVTRNLYKKALGKVKPGGDIIGELPGIDVPYEEPYDAEVVIYSDKVSSKEAVLEIKRFLEKEGWV